MSAEYKGAKQHFSVCFKSLKSMLREKLKSKSGNVTQVVEILHRPRCEQLRVRTIFLTPNRRRMQLLMDERFVFRAH